MSMLPPNPRSTASVAGHPIHPMLIPFPIAFFVATFVCDLVFWGTRNASWFDATLWLLGAGLIMAALAAVVGLTEVLGDARIRNRNSASAPSLNCCRMRRPMSVLSAPALPD